MAGVYSVPLQGAYNPPGYAQPQYDQYYQYHRNMSSSSRIMMMSKESRRESKEELMNELLKNHYEDNDCATFGFPVGIKRLHDDLEVTAAQLMLLVYKLLLLVFRVNAAGTKLQLLKD
ncbi:hypothetical protein Tco_1250817 [Tanacetum coccineum]